MTHQAMALPYLSPHLPQRSWETLPIEKFSDLVRDRLGARQGRIVLIDGDAGSGKSTLANRLIASLGQASLLRVDDVSWWLDWLNWADAMIGGVIKPWLSGESVSYRPPGWVAKDRPGAVEVPASRYLIIEGMAAIRPELLEFADATVLVTVDPQIAMERLLLRDIGIDGDCADEVFNFYVESQQAVVPFIMDQAPWKVADYVVDGTSGTDPITFASGPISAVVPSDPVLVSRSSSA